MQLLRTKPEKAVKNNVCFEHVQSGGQGSAEEVGQRQCWAALAFRARFPPRAILWSSGHFIQHSAANRRLRVSLHYLTEGAALEPGGQGLGLRVTEMVLKVERKQPLLSEGERRTKLHCLLIAFPSV